MIRKIYFTLLFWMTCWGIAEAQTIKVTGRKCEPEQGCNGDSTRFEVLGIAASSWNWTFEDPNSPDPQANRSTLAKPAHLYLQPGSYNVRVNGNLTNGQPYSKDTTIRISALPPAFEFFQGKEDTTICKDNPLVLDPYDSRFFQGTPPAEGTVKYLWYPTGDTTRTISVTEKGCYSVEVMNADSCTVTDRINVKICGESDQQASKWYFGSNAGINFEGGQPTAITDGKINTPEGTSSISNRKGDLLFYTDGRTIYDADGNPMTSRDPSDTTSLNGSPGSTQAALIVPQPSCRGCETIYYVFTTRDVNDSIRCLEYTRVDMRGNGGKGIILDKNNPTGECNVSERLTSIQNPADSSYWVLSHENETSKFILKRLTKSGLEDANSPEIGLPHTTKYQGEGQIKFATSGGKMGVVIPGPDRNYVEIYNFNDSTGAITPPPITLDLGPAPPSAYGLEFSPDGEKVYVTLRGNDSTESVLYQYDISGTDSTVIASTRIEVARSEKEFGALQYAPDGKIYMAIKDSEYLGVITPSSGDSTEVDFQLDGFYLAGKLSQLGLPNFVQSIIEPPSGPGISAEDVCFGEAMELSTGPICDPLEDKYEWDFGDGSAKGTKQSESHLYAAPGTYTVTLRQYNACKDTTMTQQVTVNPQPIANLGPDLNVCARNVRLDSKNPYPNSQYLWFKDGRALAVDSTASSIQVDSSGRYVVGVLIGDCYALDTINVTLERPPLYNLGPDQKLCTNDTLQLDALAGGTSYAWNTGQTTQVIDVTQAGNYSVVVMIPRANGSTCEVTDTVRVDVLPLPNVAVQPQASLCQPNNQAITISAGTANAMNYQYRWLPGNETTRTITVNRIGIYTVEISTSEGCTEAHNVEIIDLCQPQILVPDAFSPNGDGQNDQLEVITNHISDQDYEFRVYDRWGELIFRTTNRNEMWDGTYKGRTFPPQTYAWAVQYRSTYFPERGVETKRGAVLIAK